MQKQQEGQRGQLRITHLLPNLLTITAICAGLTAIRFGFQGRFELAVQLIIVAAILDGVDGRLARLLASDSKMGAELDSLADFLNFGIAPPLVLYLWALQDMKSAGWIAVLVYTSCCVLRLARFNVISKSEQGDAKGYFVGVPSPAGAGLVMVPMYLSFGSGWSLPGISVAAWMLVIGILLISRIPTWSFNAMTIERQNVKFLVIAFVIMIAAILTYEWMTLVFLAGCYVALVSWTLMSGKARRDMARTARVAEKVSENSKEDGGH